jgi:hypothetical protein
LSIHFISFLIILNSPSPPYYNFTQKIMSSPFFKPSNHAQKLFLRKLKIFTSKSYTLTASSTPLYPNLQLYPLLFLFAKIFSFTPLYPALP